jgi:cytochrome b involved in lipid metabolism
MSKTFTTAEVAKHTTPEAGMYIIIDSGVYDVTGTDASFVRHQDPSH